MKKASVVVPCFNASMYLDKCIGQLLNQTIGRENIEIILVDDASTDEGRTWEVITRYEKQFPDTVIAVSLEQNMRQGGARNAGISYAGGEYLIFCDADDWLLEETLEHCYRAAKEYDADVVEFLIHNISDRSLPVSLIAGGESFLWTLDTEKKKKDFLLHVDRRHSLGSQKKLYRLSMIRENGIRFAEHVIFEEPSFMLPVRFYEKRHYFLDEQLYICYRTEGSTMSGGLGEHKWDNPKVWMHLAEDLEGRGFWQKYYEELSCLFFMQGFVLSIRMVLQKGYLLAKEELTFLVNMVNRLIPDIRSNRYLRDNEEMWMTGLLDIEITNENIDRLNRDIKRHFFDGEEKELRLLRQQTDELFSEKKYDGVQALLVAKRNIARLDNDLAMVCYLSTIFEQEKAAGIKTIFEKTGSVPKLLERYTTLKFYLMRVDFDVMDNMDDLLCFLSQEQVSSYELLRAIDFCVVHKEKVLQCISEGAVREKSADDISPKENGGQGSVHRGAKEQICFIISTNNPVYAEECIYYIRHLVVPEGIEVDVLTVEEAKSLTAAYNEAMQCSQAKYKVYLHHDTFIINPYFIRDCLAVFRENPNIGMIGNIGVKKMPDSGVMWHVSRYGMLYEQHIYETELLANAIGDGKSYMEAEAIDGFLMVTQYDIPWREDLFDKWDFYDCSQSMEFIRQGYQVAVPAMKEPWCVHDCGFISLKNYDEEKEKFIREYLAGKENP